MFIAEAKKTINNILDDGENSITKADLTLDQSEKFTEIEHLLAQVNALSFDLTGISEKINKLYLIKELLLNLADEGPERLSVQLFKELKLAAHKSEYSAKVLEIGLAFDTAKADQDTKTQAQKQIQGFDLLRNLVDNYWKEVGHRYEQLAYELAEAVYRITPASPLEESVKTVQQECLTAILRGIKKFDRFNESLKKKIYEIDNLSNLYETDFYAWTQEQANSLREAAWSLIDTPNLVEEIESLGKQQQQELENRLGVLLGHLLKWEFQVSLRSKSWFSTIKEQRYRISRLLTKNPSLKPYLPEALQVGYQYGLELAVRETSLGYSKFPHECLYSLEEILDVSFFPGLKTELDFD